MPIGRFSVAVVALGSVLATGPAFPQSPAYPAKPLRMIVPFAPGGPNDILARMVGQKLHDLWGQAVVVENRGGLGGTIGMAAAAKLPAEGYNLAMAGSSNMAVAPSPTRSSPTTRSGISRSSRTSRTCPMRWA